MSKKEKIYLAASVDVSRLQKMSALNSIVRELEKEINAYEMQKKYNLTYTKSMPENIMQSLGLGMTFSSLVITLAVKLMELGAFESDLDDFMMKIALAGTSLLFGGMALEGTDKFRKLRENKKIDAEIMELKKNLSEVKGVLEKLENENQLGNY